jgi:hypothetical protein
MVKSDEDKAVEGEEEVQNFQSFSFPATGSERTIRFVGRRIQVYHETTKECKVDEDDVSTKRDFVVPAGYKCEVFGGGGSSVRFVK